MVPQEAKLGLESYISTVYLSTKGGSKLHIPFQTGPLCGKPSASTRKPIDLYPPNHRSWCENCLSLWKESRESIIKQCGYVIEK